MALRTTDVTRRIEFFVGFRPDGQLHGVEVVTVTEMAGVPFCRAGHPLADQPPQGVRVLADYPVVRTHMPR